MRKISIAICVIALTFFLSGCNATQLEDRSFPMLIAITCNEKNEVGISCDFPMQQKQTSADSGSQEESLAMEYAHEFVTAWNNYEKSLNKVSDYNHLKVILLSERFLENTEQYNAMLSMLKSKETFPRNVYVCKTDNIEAMLELEKNLSVDLGTYIEELLENHEYGKDRDLPTIGNLIDEKENQLRMIELPYLSVENETIYWKSE